jgi:hypothetical protein
MFEVKIYQLKTGTSTDSDFDTSKRIKNLSSNKKQCSWSFFGTHQGKNLFPVIQRSIKKLLISMRNFIKTQEAIEIN